MFVICFCQWVKGIPWTVEQYQLTPVSYGSFSRITSHKGTLIHLGICVWSRGVEVSRPGAFAMVYRRSGPFPVERSRRICRPSRSYWRWWLRGPRAKGNGKETGKQWGQHREAVTAQGSKDSGTKPGRGTDSPTYIRFHLLALVPSNRSAPGTVRRVGGYVTGFWLQCELDTFCSPRHYQRKPKARAAGERSIRAGDSRTPGWPGKAYFFSLRPEMCWAGEKILCEYVLTETAYSISIYFYFFIRFRAPPSSNFSR